MEARAWSDVRTESQGKEYKRLSEARKIMEMNFLLESPEGTSPTTP